MNYIPSYADDLIKFRERMEQYKLKVKKSKGRRRVKLIPNNGSSVGLGGSGL